MAKSDLGTKRICPTTGKKFYDLNKSPVISPYTGEVVPIVQVDERKIGTGTPGPVTRALLDAYRRKARALTAGEAVLP